MVYRKERDCMIKRILVILLLCLLTINVLGTDCEHEDIIYNPETGKAELWLVDCSHEKISLLDADYQERAASIVRSIEGPNTQLSLPESMASYNQELYVINGIGKRITVFNETDSGNVPPKRILEGAATEINDSFGIVVINNEIYISNVTALGVGQILVFNSTDNGNIAPKRKIEGANTLVQNPRQMFASGTELLITDYSNRIIVHNLNASGNVAPNRNLFGANTLIDTPEGIMVVNGEIFVSNRKGNFISVFNLNDTGNVAPKRRIAGANTLLNEPTGLASDGTEMHIANFMSDNLLKFPLNASGNVAPTGVGGEGIGLLGPKFIILLNARTDLIGESSKFGLTAQALEGSVELTWQNCPDLDIAGFNVYRQQDNGDWEKINAELIPCSGGIQGSGYIQWDREAELSNYDYAYKLEYVYPDGGRCWDIPVVLE